MYNNTSKQGRFIPRHPERYVGDTASIYYRSSQELDFMNFLDLSPVVSSWTSENPGTAIPYDYQGVQHTYFPDFLVRFSDDTLNRKANKIAVPREPVSLIELKPDSHYNNNVTGSDKEQVAINKAKFSAAETFCKSKGWSFRVLDLANL